MRHDGDFIRRCIGHRLTHPLPKPDRLAKFDFLMDARKNKQNWLSENPASQLILLTDTPYPRIQITYGGADEFRGSEEFDAEQFIAVKGYKAKGKRLTTYQIENIVELEPTRFPEVPESQDTPDTPDEEEETPDSDTGKVATEQEQNEPIHADEHEQARTKVKSEQQIRDEMIGQLRLFDDEE